MNTFWYRHKMIWCILPDLITNFFSRWFIYMKHWHLTEMNLTFQQDKAGRSLLTKTNIYNY